MIYPDYLERAPPVPLNHWASVAAERTLGNFRLARASCASDDGASELEGRTEGMLVLPWYGAGISRACAAYSGLMGAGM